MKTKKVSAMLLSLIMLLSILSQVCAFAETEIGNSDDWEYKLNEDNTQCVTLVKYKGAETETVTIPENIGAKLVTGIGDGACIFQSDELEAVKKVVFHQRVEKIGDYAFYNCKNLQTHNINEMESLESIGKFAFCGTNIAGTLEILFGVESIGRAAFRGLFGVLEVTFAGRNIKEIGDEAFSQTWISGIEIPKSLETIGENTFYGCKKLIKVDFSKAEKLKTIGAGAFWNCSSLVTVDFSGASSLKTIGDSAFWQCERLTKADLSTTVVETIGDKAFSACMDMDEWSGLKTVVFPKTLKSIGEAAFEQDMMLSEMNLPNSLEYIGDSAFATCIMLSGDIMIPANVEYLGEGAFALCGNVKIKLDANNKFYMYDENGVLYNTEKTVLLCAPAELESITVPESVTRIADYAFVNVNTNTSEPDEMFISKLSKITLSEGLKNIGNMAFAYCVGLTDVKLPKGLERIDDYAFMYSGLSKINIPVSVKYVSSEAFQYCDLTEATYEGSQKHWNDFLDNNKSKPNSSSDNDLLESVPITFLGGTYTAVSTVDNKSKFNVAVDDEYNNKTVIIAFYKDNCLVEVYHESYDGTNEITYSPTAAYDSAKVMLWNDFATFAPVTEAEIVDLG